MNHLVANSTHRFRMLRGLLAMGAGVASAHAYDLLRGAWPTGEVEFHLNLDDGTGPPLSGGELLDGSSNWNSVFQASMNLWNAELNRIQLVAADPVDDADVFNGRNEVAFAEDVYGEEWGENTLGITLYLSTGADPFNPSETDILFPVANVNWNSYRGPNRATTKDFRRVAAHELGHAIGLAHPNQAHPPQAVEALMNSTISDIEGPVADDIAGARTLYEEALPTLAFTRELSDITGQVGEIAALSFEINGEVPGGHHRDPALSFSWFFPTNRVRDQWRTLQTPHLQIGALQPYDAGTYFVRAWNPDSHIQSTATVTVEAVTTSAQTRLGNLSTRAYVGSGNRNLTVGFVIVGDSPRRMLLRAVGPTLGQEPFNLASVHPDPTLRLVRTDGDLTLINQAWNRNTSASAAQIAAVTEQVGGFPLPAGSRDAVLLVELPPGIYTATAEGLADEEGVAIVEIYEVDAEANDSRLVNLSSRAHVGTGADIIIAGLAVTGPGPRSYLIRAAGDTLADFGIIGDNLDDPVLSVYHQDGTLLRESDDWDDPAHHQPMLATAMQRLGAFPFTDRQESALKLTLFPGSYTVQVTGWENSQGVALVEIYEFPEG